MAIYSHSRLDTYQNCPRQYQFQYIDKIRTKEKGIEAFLGSRVHEALEKLYSDLLNGKRNSREEILAFYDQQWEQNWDEKSVIIVRRQYSPEHYYQVGWSCMDNYYRRHQPFHADTTLGVEIRIMFLLDDEGKYRMMGYIDRLARNKDGLWEIHDYKTSGHLPTQDDVDSRIQLALYQIGVQQKWPQIDDIRLVWHFLRHDTILRSRWTVQQLKDLRQQTIALIDCIESDDNYLPRETNLCNWCDFQDRCPVKKHPLEISAMSAGDREADTGVQLVDRYAQLSKLRQDLKDQDAAIRDDMETLEKQIIDYGRRRGIDVVAGNQYLARIIRQRKIKLPLKGEDRRQALEEALRRSGKWEEVIGLQVQTLKSIIADSRWDGDILEKLKPYIEEEVEVEVKLSRKNELE